VVEHSRTPILQPASPQGGSSGAIRFPQGEHPFRLGRWKSWDARHEEILDWLIRKSGSTRIKAEVEWQKA
jgi:hypothetical protein